MDGHTRGRARWTGNGGGLLEEAPAAEVTTLSRRCMVTGPEGHIPDRVVVPFVAHNVGEGGQTPQACGIIRATGEEELVVGAERHSVHWTTVADEDLEGFLRIRILQVFECCQGCVCWCASHHVALRRIAFTLCFVSLHCVVFTLCACACV